MSCDAGLLPCPFCGGKADIIHGAPGCSFVRCSACSADTNDVSAEQAGRLWNTRASPASTLYPELVEALEKCVFSLQRYISYGDGDEYADKCVAPYRALLARAREAKGT